MIRTPYLAIPVVLAMAAVGAGCRGDTQTTTDPATLPVITASEMFSGLLPVLGSSFYPFTLTQAATVSATLNSLMPNATGPAATTPVRLSIGVASDTGCSPTTSVTATPALVAQLSASLTTPGTYCVDITDAGSLSAPLNFVIRISRDAVATNAASTITETFSSFLATSGSSAHTISLLQGGTISLTLTSVTPSSAVGLGVGVSTSGGSGCSLSTSVTVPPGTSPQITVPIESGNYCVEVFDAGSLTGTGAFFSMTIAHP